jgi:hypothetical protein
MEKKAFMFYMNWEQQVDLMTDVELRRFIKNLCRYADGEPIELPTREEKLCWLGIVPALKINDEKYEKKVQANRENGKLGGAPKGNQNASKDKTTQINPNNLITENREMESDNREKLIEKSKMEMEKGEMENENNEIENKSEIPVNVGFSSINSNNSKYHGGMSMYEFNKQRGLPY